MLHIIFLILKIAGILLLAVLGILLSFILLVLFVPVRYRICGSYYEKVQGKVKITWLLHILSITAVYDKGPVISIRLFGLRILKPKKKEEIHDAEDLIVQALEVTDPEPQEEKREEERPGQVLPAPETQTIQTHEQGKKKKRFSWQRLFLKWKESITGCINKLKSAVRRFCDTLKNLKEKKDEVLSWIFNKENKKTAKLLLKQGKKLIGHVLPQKGRGKLLFGFEDPYMTGQALMTASVAYPFCHKQVEFIPVFDQEVLKGEGSFKGRIRIGTLIFVGLRMLFDRNFRRLLKKWLR